MIQSRERGEQRNECREGEEESDRRGGREKSETGMSHNSHVIFHCQLENKGSKVG